MCEGLRCTRRGTSHPALARSWLALAPGCDGRGLNDESGAWRGGKHSNAWHKFAVLAGEQGRCRSRIHERGALQTLSLFPAVGLAARLAGLRRRGTIVMCSPAQPIKNPIQPLRKTDWLGRLLMKQISFKPPEMLTAVEFELLVEMALLFFELLLVLMLFQKPLMTHLLLKQLLMLLMRMHWIEHGQYPFPIMQSDVLTLSVSGPVWGGALITTSGPAIPCFGLRLGLEEPDGACKLCFGSTQVPKTGSGFHLVCATLGYVDVVGNDYGTEKYPKPFRTATDVVDAIRACGRGKWLPW